MSSAIIGYGNWGKRFFSELVKSAKVDYVFTRAKLTQDDIESIKSLSPRTKNTNSISDILLNKKINNVFILTPIKTHFKLTKLLIQQGKNVFCEKILCRTLRQHKELERLAVKNRVKLQVGYVYLYHPAIIKLKNLIRKTKVKEVKVDWLKYGTFMEDINENLTSHVLSIFIFLFENIKKIEIVKSVGTITDCDNIIFRVHQSKGVVTNACINRASDIKKFSIEIGTDKSKMIWEGNTISIANKQKNQVIFRSRQSPLRNEIRAFLAKKAPLDVLKISRQVTTLLENFLKKQ